MFCAVAAFTTAAADGAFINGVETFDGTVKDTATWNESTYGGTNIVQNNELTIFGGDFTTKNLKIGIGQSVSAKMRLMPSPGSGTTFVAYLLLDTDSAGLLQAPTVDSRFVGISFWTDTAKTQVFGVDGNFNGSSGGFDTPLIANLTPARGNQTFIAQVERLSLTSMRLTARDATTNAQLGQLTYTFNAARGPVPADLFISLFGKATYDDVTVPEPAAVSLLLAPFALTFSARCGRRSPDNRRFTNSSCHEPTGSIGTTRPVSRR